MTDPHSPWQPVTLARLEAARDIMDKIGGAVTYSGKETRGRLNWWAGGVCMGYLEVATDQYYLHPMFMDAHELDSFETISGFEHLKEDSIFNQMAVLGKTLTDLREA